MLTEDQIKGRKKTLHNTLKEAEKEWRADEGGFFKKVKKRKEAGHWIRRGVDSYTSKDGEDITVSGIGFPANETKNYKEWKQEYRLLRALSKAKTKVVKNEDGNNIAYFQMLPKDQYKKELSDDLAGEMIFVEPIKFKIGVLHLEPSHTYTAQENALIEKKAKKWFYKKSRTFGHGKAPVQLFDPTISTGENLLDNAYDKINRSIEKETGYSPLAFDTAAETGLVLGSGAALYTRDVASKELASISQGHSAKHWSEMAEIAEKFGMAENAAEYAAVAEKMGELLTAITASTIAAAITIPLAIYQGARVASRLYQRKQTKKSIELMEKRIDRANSTAAPTAVDNFYSAISAAGVYWKDPNGAADALNIEL